MGDGGNHGNDGDGFGNNGDILAVRACQMVHRDEILRLWGEDLCPGGVCQPTGIVGFTTRQMVNRLICGV